MKNLPFIIPAGLAALALVLPARVHGQAPNAPAAVADQPREFTIPLERQQLIGVTYAAVTESPLQRTVRAVGVVAASMDKHWDYVARVDGYVHTLDVVAPGDPVEKGQVLMDLYSPELVATENEYVDLLRMRDLSRRNENAAAVETAERLLAGARARLEQWNISGAQIDAVEQAGKADQYLALTSPVRGIVEAVNVHQGQRVSPGDHLVDLVDLSMVCVYAEFYENEIPVLKAGLPVTIRSSALPNLALSGRIGVIDPNLDEVKRTGKVRIDVVNPDTELRPGAYVDVTLQIDEGHGLIVPVGAVLPTGERNIVFVDKGSGRLEPRFVQLGGEYGSSYCVSAGLKAGERVVTSANFLVDAESNVQGALKAW